MYTPRKNFNHKSPYTKPVHQYPSQSEEYISFGVGGQFPSGNDSSSGHLQYPSGSNRQRRGNTNFFSNQESYNHSDSYSTQKQWGTPRKTVGCYRNKFHKEKHEQASISSYLHPSMTEDPWQQFMDRIDAISNSRISLKSELEDGSRSAKTVDNPAIDADVV